MSINKEEAFERFSRDLRRLKAAPDKKFRERVRYVKEGWIVPAHRCAPTPLVKGEDGEWRVTG